MSPAERKALIEAVTTAHRERDPHGRVLGHRSFYDLDEEGRREAFEETLRARALERAIDPAGLTPTVRVLLARIRRSGGAGPTGERGGPS
jgi:hypothetical protein